MWKEILTGNFYSCPKYCNKKLKSYSNFIAIQNINKRGKWFKRSEMSFLFQGRHDTIMNRLPVNIALYKDVTTSILKESNIERKCYNT